MMRLITLDDYEKAYKEHGLLYGWCHTCNKEILTEYGPRTNSVRYSLPEACRQHNVIIKWNTERRW